MTNSKFKLLLDNLRALILKSRPAYRDYIGTENVIEKTVLISGKLSADGESVNAKDAFKGFVEGETYKVTVGDETVDATAQYGTGSFSGCIVIGSSNVMPSDEIPGWMICVYNGNLLGYGTGEWTGKPVEVFTEKTVKVDRWDVKKLPEECLPDGLAKQKDVAKQAVALKQVELIFEDDIKYLRGHVTTAQDTADAAQSTANAAKTAADTAQNSADAAAAAASAAQKTADTAQRAAGTAQTSANAANSVANSVKDTAATKKNPVFTGHFSQNRKEGTLTGQHSHAEGYLIEASGESSHAEGYQTQASGAYGSHAEGMSTVASGQRAHAEGNATKATGHNSHSEGQMTTASGAQSHAEGSGTTANEFASHSEGLGTIASRSAQHVEGQYNIDDGADSTKLHIVGNGTSNEARSNAHTLDESGNAWYAGDVYIGSTSGTNKDAGSKKLATQEYVDNRSFTFTITPVDGQVSPNLSATRAEMLAALDAGKTLLGYWTETRTILDTTDTIKHEFRLESVSGTGASRGLAFVNYEQFYKSTLYVNGNDTISFVDKEVLPAPMTKTEAMTQSVGMDNDGRLWTEPGASGGGVTTLHINVTAVNQDTLQATFTADKTPSEMQQAAVTGPIWCVITFAAGIFEDNPVTCGLPPAWQAALPAFGYVVPALHDEDGTNTFVYAVRGGTDSTWIINTEAFGSST